MEARQGMGAAAVLKLQTAGFTAEQVAALAELVDTQAASKSDLLEVKSELKSDLLEVKSELKSDLLAVEHRLETAIAGVKAELMEADHRLESKIEHDVGAVKADVLVLKWMMGFVLAFQVAIFGKLVLH